MKSRHHICILALLCFSIVSCVNNYEQAIHYARTHPTRDGGTWAGWCAALMIRTGDHPGWAVRESAIIAYRSSRIISKDHNTAPSGAYHWWDIGVDGHVAMATTRGMSLMASNHVTDRWGDAIGTISIVEYNRRSGARYLGWSYDYAGSELRGIKKGPLPPSAPNKLPLTDTANDGVPGANYYKRQQYFASKHGYTGPIDGALGRGSWAGTQRGLRQFGYTGPDDGVPGPQTYKAMQRCAAKFGYRGPIDGSLGRESYKGFARYLNTL